MDEYEAMLSLAEAASHLLCDLLTSHGLAIRNRTLVLAGIFQLLDKSLSFAKRSSESSKETQSQVEIFQGAFISLRGSLENQFSGNLFSESKERRREEFQVRGVFVVLFVVVRFKIGLSS